MDTQIEVVFNRLLTSALEQKASDLFLFPGQKPFIRTEGIIKDLLNEQVLTANFIEVILGRILSPEQQEIFKRQQQLIFSRELGKNHRARVNVFRQNNLAAISIKLIPNKIISLEQLKLPKIVTDLAALKKGMIIVSGPKDSGRSNLVAAMIDYINKNSSRYISTLERPIENVFVGHKSLVEQREIGRDVLSFADGLNSVKNKSVDVLMVSEVESPTIFLELLQIVQRGILVIALMEVDTVYNVIRQTIESFEPEKQGLAKFLFGETLGGIICTRLVSRIGGGRVLALEVFNGSPVAKNLIKEGRVFQLKNIFQVTEKELSISLDRFLADLVKSGQITLEEALKHAIEPESLKSLTNY